MDGLEILNVVKREHPSVPVVVISGHGTIGTAVQAIKLGAYDFVEKPFKADRLILVVERAIEAAKLRQENEELRVRAGPEAELIGDSAVGKQVAGDLFERELIEGQVPIQRVDDPVAIFPDRPRPVDRITV